MWGAPCKELRCTCSRSRLCIMGPARRILANSTLPPICIATHALHAPIPRRSARPASGFGSREQARQVEEGRTGVEGAVAVPAGEDAVLHGERPEAVLSRLLHRQAR